MNSTFTELDATRPLTELTTALNSLCDEAESDRHATTLVLRLTAPAAPSEPAAWPGEVTVSSVNRWERALRRLEKLDATTVVLAQGACAGPAVELLLAADVGIGVRGLTLTLPVNDGHFWPGMALYRLVRRLGAHRTRRLLLWDGGIPLARALELGLIDRGAETAEEAEATARTLTSHLADRETALRRQLITEAETTEYDEALGVHLAACDRELRRMRTAGRAA
ncbi:enoyl-CoA-hydratase DpgB [Streptomyces sp. NBC_00102]|uniref:enoyl-CoA-hydratase DpgB n=1 Tax=Streptomyces sp. NBC_00102 TaxID=2975652 RepID=UPI002256AC6C|nr:enoyl-CoA-hydratase DpgB [Streptomyces sp. NBC_00102]MCX5400290.1 enoyl-CoA hydratase/isomerase family protein [Streptomyces sp. NBC_00102]